MNLQEYFLLVLTFCSMEVLIILADDLTDDDIDKRAPGWGKRASDSSGLGYLQSVFNDLSKYELNNEDNDNLDLDKRRPGWGKRSFSGEFNMAKRRPGWGKRSFDDEEYEQMDQKRAPGWGKRSDQRSSSERLFAESSYAKRRPGWGKRDSLDDYDVDKRRPGWGKRAPGWGKRSGLTKCQSIINDMRLTRIRYYQLNDEAQEQCTKAVLDDESPDK